MFTALQISYTFKNLKLMKFMSVYISYTCLVISIVHHNGHLTNNGTKLIMRSKHSISGLFSVCFVHYN